MSFPAIRKQLFMVSKQRITVRLHPDVPVFFSWASSDPLVVEIIGSGTGLTAELVAHGECGFAEIKVGAPGYQTTIIEVYFDKELPKQLNLTIDKPNASGSNVAVVPGV
jgi:hypothetical protein